MAGNAEKEEEDISIVDVIAWVRLVSPQLMSDIISQLGIITADVITWVSLISL